MARTRKVQNGMNPPGVGGGGRNENENKKEKPIRQKQGDTASKGVSAAHGPFRRSSQHHPETIFSSTGDTADDEVNKPHWSSLLMGTRKPIAVESECNIFTIKNFHLCILCTAPFHHLAIPPCEHECVFCGPFHHIFFSIALFNPFHHIAILPYEHRCVFSTPFHHIRITIIQRRFFPQQVIQQMMK